MVPDVTIIIPTCHRPVALDACLRLLLPQVPGDGAAEILVCDDSRTPETQEMLGRLFPSVRRIVGPRNGSGANRNAGAREACGPWLIFLDDDVLPAPGFLPAYLGAIRDAGADGPLVFVGATHPSGGHSKSLLWESPHYHADEVLPPSCNFAIPRKTYLANGGFDERFRYSFEDMEFFARLERVGIPLRFVNEAAVEHPMRRRPSGSVLARRWESRVISAYDLGAGRFDICWRLPKHVLLVILSRFRGVKPVPEHLRVAWLFAGEFFGVLVRLPGWLVKFHNGPRSTFWIDQVNRGKSPRNFGL
jgi:GT2 family glycosyltransferase